MKKLLSVFSVFFIVILFSVFGSGCKDSKPKGDVIKLSYSIFFPPTHGQCIAAVEWAKEIEKRTEGRVKIDVFPGGTLTPANECYDGVVKGVSDLGMSCFAYTRGKFPVMEAVDLPLGYVSGRSATYSANEFYKKVNPDELKNVKVLYLHAHGPGLLHTKTPVRKLEDLKGLKIRSTGLSAKVVELLGGTAVAMPQSSTYEALQKGVVDGTFTPVESLKGWKQAEVVKYTTDCNGVGYTTAMFVVMNLDKWNALPDDIKEIFEKTNSEWIEVHASNWDTLDVEGMKYTKSLNNEVIKLSDAENSRWVEKVNPVVNEYISTNEKNGLAVKKSVAELKEIVKKNNSKYAQ